MISQMVRILKQNIFWVGLLALVYGLSVLLLWIADADAFWSFLVVLLLFLVLLFAVVCLFLAKKEKKRQTAFRDFLEKPDAYQEAVLLKLVDGLQAEDVQYLGKVLRRQMELYENANTQLEDYEEYVEIWAHEIKTPLSLLTFLLDNRREELPETVIYKLDTVNCRIQNYIEQMLYYSRLKGGRKDYLFEKIPVAECVDEVLSEYEPLLKEKKMKIEKELLSDTVYTDKRGLCFMIGQFISNAIKYSAENPELKICFYRDAKAYQLSFRDNGIGVKACDLPYIFEKGFTGDSGDSRKKATGMGLYLAKEMASDLNLTLDAVSDLETQSEENAGDRVLGQGRGFEITISFPVVE